MLEDSLTSSDHASEAALDAALGGTFSGISADANLPSAAAAHRGERLLIHNMARTFARSPEIPIRPADRFVIFSDLHMGDGSRTDDFAHNAPLFQAILERHYLDQNFRLVLNGDVEELHKYPLARNVARWQPLYDLFAQFALHTKLYKIAGNHDDELLSADCVYPLPVPILEGLRLRHGGETLFIFHGHQASWYQTHWLAANRWLVRWVVKPLGIKNYTLSHNTRLKFKLEQRVYQFARERRLLACIGHTHRPLFESLSKVDWLRFRIEQLCREYPLAAPDERSAIEAEIQTCNAELAESLEKDRREFSRRNRMSPARWMRSGSDTDSPRPSHAGTIYTPEPLVPCMFNSGCVIGKRGLTGLEIADGRIALVHWFDSRVSSKHLSAGGHPSELLAGTPYHRIVLKDDPLDYILTRIRLLG